MHFHFKAYKIVELFTCAVWDFYKHEIYLKQWLAIDKDCWENSPMVVNESLEGGGRVTSYISEYGDVRAL